MNLMTNLILSVLDAG